MARQQEADAAEGQQETEQVGALEPFLEQEPSGEPYDEDLHIGQKG